MVVNHADFDAGRLPAADHYVHPGIDPESGRMARVDESLQIIEIRRPLAVSPTASDPSRHLFQSRSDGGSEQHISAGGPDIHDDVRESHFGDAAAVPGDGIGIIAVAREIRRGVDPQIPGLFF